MSAHPGRSLLEPIGRVSAGVALTLALLMAASPVKAAQVAPLSIPAGPLDRALTALGIQAGIDVGGTMTGLGGIRTQGVSGRLTPEAALRRLLAPTPYEAQRVGPTTFRITLRRRPPRIAPIRSVPVDAPAAEILVTAGKRDSSLLRFAGSISAYTLAPLGVSPVAADDLRAFADTLPVLQSTELGAGRNKIFVRGIADSSFNGPTQSTTGVYFGDVQVGYSGPDPNLNLFDVDRVEVIEGPQGTLYGAGAIGGVITLQPNAPTLDRFGGAVRAGVTATQSGAIGYDGAAMLNVPLVRDAAGLRGVAYRTVDGGYIDDLGRGLRNVNRTRIEGGRLALRVAPRGGWTVDSSVLLQRTDARDAQYAERGLPGETRQSALSQPFTDRFLLGRLVVEKRWASGLRLHSATGWVDRTRDESFDATRIEAGGRPLIYTATSKNRLLSHETRLSRTTANGASWVLGIAALYDRETFSRVLGMPNNPVDINGVTNRTTSFAAFGEATVPLWRRLAVTGGGRLTRARTDGDPTTTTRNTIFVHGQISFRFDPAIGLNYLLTPRLAAFARYQSGFRTGGLAVARGVGRVANFDRDTIGVVEGGLRLQRSGVRGISGAVAFSYADWDAIQADLVNNRGLPYSTNIGQGEIKGLEATADWVPLVGLKIGGAMFLAQSRLKNPVAALETERGSALPNVPRLALSGNAGYAWRIGGGDVVRLFGAAHFRGHSVLGTGPLLGARQGGYASGSIGGSWSHGGLALTLQLDNVLNSDGERFALGNPFQLSARDQYTPLRPRNVRIGADYRW